MAGPEGVSTVAIGGNSKEASRTIVVRTLLEPFGVFSGQQPWSSALETL